MPATGAIGSNCPTIGGAGTWAGGVPDGLINASHASHASHAYMLCMKRIDGHALRCGLGRSEAGKLAACPGYHHQLMPRPGRCAVPPSCQPAPATATPPPRPANHQPPQRSGLSRIFFDGSDVPSSPQTPQPLPPPRRRGQVLLQKRYQFDQLLWAKCSFSSSANRQLL